VASRQGRGHSRTSTGFRSLRGRLSSNVGERGALCAVLALGAILRFPTLGVQSFWTDESYTVELMRSSFRGMMTAIPHTESTPPLYYVSAWLWTRAFGTSEVGLRSWSALVGTATIIVVYRLGSDLISERAGVLAAAMSACNPLLVWYSQEARSYAMMAFLLAASLYFLNRARTRANKRDVLYWSLLSCLAVCTHYFSAFFVLTGGLLLVYWRRSWAAVGALGLVVGVGIALIPLARYQTEGKSYAFRGESLVSRLAQVVKQFLDGYDVPGSCCSPSSRFCALQLDSGRWFYVAGTEA
jgi:mannosyltransferase